MIDRAELRAIQIASANAKKAAIKGQMEDLGYATRQQIAFAEIRQKTREILAAHNVKDIYESELQENLPPDDPILESVANGLVTLNQDQLANFPLGIERSSFGSLSRYFRKLEGISQRELGRRIGDKNAYAKVSRLERSKLLPSLEIAEMFAQTYGWEPDDPRAILLRQAAVKERTQRMHNPILRRPQR